MNDVVGINCLMVQLKTHCQTQCVIMAHTQQQLPGRDDEDYDEEDDDDEYRDARPDTCRNWNTHIEQEARHGHEACVRFLCEQFADADVNAALHAAAAAGHLHVVRYLCTLPLERGVKPGSRNNRAVRLAAERGRLPVVQYLRELPAHRGVDPCANDFLAFRMAAVNEHVDVMRLLCQWCGGPHATLRLLPDVDSIIVGAVAMRHLSVVQFLCELTATSGVSLMHVNACLRNVCAHTYAMNLSTNIVSYLCQLPTERGIDPATNGNEPLIVAAQAGNVRLVQRLCELPHERGVDPMVKHFAPLRIAIEWGRLQVVRYLLELPMVAHAVCVSDLASVAFVSLCYLFWQRQVSTFTSRILRVLRVLVFEIPGGDMWLERVASGREHLPVYGKRTLEAQLPAMVAASFASPLPSRLLHEAHVHLLWRRRRTLLLLRLLRERGRGTVSRVTLCHAR